MADNITVDNGNLTDYTAKSTETGGVHVQHVRTDLDAAYTSEVEDTGTFIYVGWAAPGTATSAAEWRVMRVDTNGGKKWADGNGAFDNIWDNRAGLSYS